MTTTPIATPIWTTRYDPRADCPACRRALRPGESVCYHNNRVPAVTAETPTELWHAVCARALELEDLL